MVGKTRILTKTPDKIKIMAEGGKKLAKIKAKLTQAINEGTNAQEIDELAEELIKKENGTPSFKAVTGYSWATCVNVNDGVVHGVPKKQIVFKRGDIVSVDVGFYYKGFHTDTSFSVGVKPAKDRQKFLDIGKTALARGIEKAVPGKRIFDISKAIQDTLEEKGTAPIRALVGHGIGKKLHEAPLIPCFVSGRRSASPEIAEGDVLAIEVMYTKGKPDVKLAQDGWTILTKDGKIAGLFEETVASVAGGPLILTT